MNALSTQAAKWHEKRIKKIKMGVSGVLFVQMELSLPCAVPITLNFYVTRRVILDFWGLRVAWRHGSMGMGLE